MMICRFNKLITFSIHSTLITLFVGYIFFKKLLENLFVNFLLVVRNEITDNRNSHVCYDEMMTIDPLVEYSRRKLVTSPLRSDLSLDGAEHHPLTHNLI
jgi:hypothetical protein